MPALAACALLLATGVHATGEAIRPPSLFALAPASGPTRGGTLVSLSGAHLQPEEGVAPICRFGLGGLLSRGGFRGVASHGIVTCAAPPADSGYEVAVELSLDGGASFTRAGFRFSYYHEAEIRSASPSSGPAAGGTLVTVAGYNFGHEPPNLLQCAFGWRRVPATLLDFEHLRCTAPPNTANGSLSLSFEDRTLQLVIDQVAVRGHASIAGAAALGDGVLTLAEERLFPPPSGPFPPPPPPPPQAFVSTFSAAGGTATFVGTRPAHDAGAVARPAGRFGETHSGDSRIGSIGALNAHSSSSSSSSIGSGAALGDGSHVDWGVRHEAVQTACGVLSVSVPRDTHVPPRGFAASFELLMRGEGARGIALSYGELQPTAASHDSSAANGTAVGAGVGGGISQLWDEFGAARGVSVRLLANSPNHYRPLSIEIALHQQVSSPASHAHPARMPHASHIHRPMRAGAGHGCSWERRAAARRVGPSPRAVRSRQPTA